ncbi:hypothetical protein DM01DRAFT_1341081 [Hesseltinella vesiculosa]|uniref:Cas12f1-like TNB domain-containing protein n=1 Tax=Hesseltinella vesiculosa TaxID=101127 RepID=A0A1X2G398_9FUNG|nr:hypothetical protein DM01DRAFT_1341081 [Hesseltinella vesiculosa]
MTERRSAPAMKATTRLSHGVTKHVASPDRVPMIVFGDGLKGKKVATPLKKQLPGPSNLVFNNLEERQSQGRLLVVSIWEFNTSKRCCICHDKLKPFYIDGSKIYGLLRCDLCRVVLDRDTSAASNMFAIARHYFDHRHRLLAFCPLPRPPSPEF